MKHKAQESLETFKKCMRNITNYTFNEKEKCDFKTKDTENMQNLIDCQLTEEEINWIIIKAEFTRIASMNTETQDLCTSICKKLDKQKEMWCKNDKKCK